MRLPATWVKLWLLLLLSFLTSGFAAPPGTLGARLELERVPGLTVTLRESDASSARYTVGEPESVPAVSEAVKTYLVDSGWLSHPNVSEAPAPEPGVVQQLTSFVQGSGFLEVRTVRAGQGEVTLELTLISLEAPPQVAAVP